MKRVYLENVKPLTFEQTRERHERVEHERTKFYVNRLPSEVYILDRSGLLTKIKPRVESQAFDPDFLFICEKIQCTPEITNDYTQQARQTPNSMRQYAHRVVLSNWSGEPPVSSRWSVEAGCGLSLTTLLEGDGIVYLEEHDIVVLYGLTEKEMREIQHPYSLAGYTMRSFKQVCENNGHIRKGDFTFNIRIVDNNDQFGSRWILIEDKPFCIVASKDDEITDGIYVTYSKNSSNGKGPQRLMTDRFDFKDSGNLPHYKLYESQQEAMLARRSSQVDEATSRLQELESKAATAQNNLKKAQQERENLEAEALFRKQKHESDMERLRKEQDRMTKEHELFMQKQVGEMLSIRKKNTIEIIKCVPLFLSAIATTAALLKKRE